jgi:hypothetical protein
VASSRSLNASLEKTNPDRKLMAALLSLELGVELGVELELELHP